jgi:hypothetical protein
MALFKHQNHDSFLSENTVHCHNPAYRSSTLRDEPSSSDSNEQAGLARYKSLATPSEKVKE